MLTPRESALTFVGMPLAVLPTFLGVACCYCMRGDFDSVSDLARHLTACHELSESEALVIAWEMLERREVER